MLIHRLIIIFLGSVFFAINSYGEIFEYKDDKENSLFSNKAPLVLPVNNLVRSNDVRQAHIDILDKSKGTHDKKNKKDFQKLSF